jgi:hypothetical protein
MGLINEEIVWRKQIEVLPLLVDGRSAIKETFKNSGYQIIGDNLIIFTIQDDGSIIAKPFNLNKISAFKLDNNSK